LENLRRKIRSYFEKLARLLLHFRLQLSDTSECAIELPGELGWFTFVVTDVPRGAIKLIGRAKIEMRP